MTPVVELSPQNAFTWKHYFASAMCLVFYDYRLKFWRVVITLDLEIERIWRAPPSMFVLLWVNVRYLPLLAAVVITTSVFSNWPKAVRHSFTISRPPDSVPGVRTIWELPARIGFGVLPTVFLLAGITLAHIVFLLRTFALYGRDRRVLYMLVPILAAEVATALWGVSTEKHIEFHLQTGCFPDSPRRIQGLVMWAVPFAFDASVFLLTTVKSVQYIRQHKGVGLVTVILRDGLIYFGSIFVFYLANIAMFVFSPGDIRDINAPMTGMVTMVITARLILNLRGAVGAKPPSPSYAPRFTLTGMESILAAFDGPLDTEERQKDAAWRAVLETQHEQAYELQPIPPRIPNGQQEDSPPKHPDQLSSHALVA
ncbi:hypothetical protein AURDEDRAFT_165250 [Auricularia subglabra TFB-10046 SS5]|nr:hypothetical protein AURDEDRAFT_165250 [Auricularia subglabra TFB-10046 SS5]